MTHSEEHLRTLEFLALHFAVDLFFFFPLSSKIFSELINVCLDWSLLNLKSYFTRPFTIFCLLVEQVNHAQSLLLLFFSNLS